MENQDNIQKKEKADKGIRKEGGNRFAMVCRKMLTEQKKTLLVMTGGYLGLCLVLGIWSGVLGGAPQEGPFVMYMLLAWLACSIGASKMFFDMTTKEGRTSLLMTPASAADKYIPRLIVVLPGIVLLTVIGYFAYAFSDVLALGLRYDIWCDIYNPFDGWDKNSSKILFMTVAMFLLNESFFIYGAIAWPKKSFLKTLCCVAALQIILSFLLTGIWKLMEQVGYGLQVEDSDAFAISVSVITTLIAIAIMYASYIRFTRSTLIR